MNTFKYEICVEGVKNKDGDVTRKPQRIAHKEGLIEEPTREDLLIQYASEIKELGVSAKEVSVNIGPFLG